MCSDQSPWSEADSLSLANELRRQGVVAFGVAQAEEVTESDISQLASWLAEGCQGQMHYLENNAELRRNPQQLLEGAQSIISCALPYYHPSAAGAHIAPYALGRDYHEVVWERLGEVAAWLETEYGCHTRVCCDTAPVRERYWAVKSGVGTIGLNGHLQVPDYGSRVVLGEIITTLAITPTQPLVERLCTRCGKCVKACPAKAIRANGIVDARQCLSYLTIEHRGELPEGTNLHGCLFGCDICSAVCPLNATVPPTDITDFMPRTSARELTAESALQLTQQQFSTIFSHSAVKRAKLAGLQRNARQITLQKYCVPPTKE